MLGRFWWKEGRAFGPIALVLVGAAIGFQWLLIWGGYPQTRTGLLTPLNLVWAVLYAFAVGSAAFAGERETRTLGFLDALPVGRSTLWLGKVSFAMVSTLVLALILAGIAATGTKLREPDGFYGYWWLSQMFGTLLFEAVAWGLFWSSVSKNALLAATLSVLSLGAVSVVTNLNLDTRIQAGSSELISPEAIPIRLAVGLVALSLSGICLTYRPGKRPRWISRFRRVRWDRRVHVPSPPRASVTRSLVWQTVREGWTTAILSALMILGPPILIRMQNSGNNAPFEIFLAWLGCLVAGVAVFGVDGGSATPRFLVVHGVRVGTVWRVKVVVWSLVLTVISCLLLASLPIEWIGRFRLEGMGLTSGASLSSLATVFTIGLVSGMAIPRRITAVLVGVIGVVFLVPVPLVLLSSEMVPPWSLWLTPLILLGISRWWARDWMVDRDGVGARLRLTGLTVVSFALLASTYVGWRAWGHPDPGPQYPLVASPRGLLSPDQDAVRLYRRASIEGVSDLNLSNADWDSVDLVIERGWSEEHPEAIAWWRTNRAWIELARQASALPQARFDQQEGRTPSAEVVTVAQLAKLLGLDTRERLSRGDLPGAWSDILAQFRMAEQVSKESPTLARMITARLIFHRATGMALEWANDPKQTLDTLRVARVDLKSVPGLPPASAVIGTEAKLLDQTFDLSTEDLESLINEITSGAGIPALSRWIIPWWERVHARRLCRLLIARILREAAINPYQRPASTHFDDVPRGSPLARLVFPAFATLVGNLDVEVARLRALDQVLAIRSWQLAHEGKSPGSLNDLVPEFFGRLPIDPYSGRTFGYVPAVGQYVQIPVLDASAGANNLLTTTRPGQMILYSVGPNLVDDMKTERVSDRAKGQGDLMFPIP